MVYYFADHQVEYSVSLSHCFFQGLKFCARQAYSEIHELYVPRKLPRMRYYKISIYCSTTYIPDEHIDMLHIATLLLCVYIATCVAFEDVTFQYCITKMTQPRNIMYIVYSLLIPATNVNYK